MNTVIFSASILDIKPLWVLAPSALYIAFHLLRMTPFAERVSFIKSRRTLKIFAIVQLIALFGHIYAFTTELVPYYLGRSSVVEGDVSDFKHPTNRFNRHESFCVNGVLFDYNYNNISFGYRGGIIDENAKDIRVYYVHNALNDENVIIRIEKIEQNADIQ